MNIGKLAVSAVIVFLVLLIFSFVGAVTMPSFANFTNVLVSTPLQIIFFLLSVIVLTLIGFTLGRGIRSIKSPWEAILLTYISAILIGGLLALLTSFNFPYAVHINYNWLGSQWYDPWITVLIVGAPIMLAFVV